MAKGFYVPVNGLSKKVKKWYVPVNGLSKAVSKAYCPVSGLSKQFWTETTPSTFLIPQMTSNTQPEGVCTAGDGIDNNYAYYAFDRDLNTYVGASSNNTYGWVQYEFATPVTISCVMVTARQLSLTGTYTFTLKVSLYYESEWHEYGQFTLRNQGMSSIWEIYSLQDQNPINGVEKIKVETLNPKLYGESYLIAEIQAQ